MTEGETLVVLLEDAVAGALTVHAGWDAKRESR